MSTSCSILSSDPASDNVLESFWGQFPAGRLSNNERGDDEGSAPKLPPDAYYQFYNRQCQYYNCQRQDEEPACIHSVADLKAVVDRLKSDETWEDLILYLKLLSAKNAGSSITAQGATIGSPSDNESPLVARSCEKAINFAALQLVMVDFNEERPDLAWKSGSLRGYLSTRLKSTVLPSFGGAEDRKLRFPRTFDAWSLDKVGGIRVELTDNLLDHLRLVEDDSKVRVFHHACFLERQRQHSTSLLPPGLAEETLRTLSILFPEAEFWLKKRKNGSKRRWLRQLTEEWSERSRRTVDGRLARCGNPRAVDRRLSSYPCWGERLRILKQAYDDAKPTTFTQWWHDRRNGEQWYPFWIALMIFAVATFLSVVQCVIGALQLWKAWSQSN